MDQLFPTEPSKPKNWKRWSGTIDDLPLSLRSDVQKVFDAWMQATGKIASTKLSIQRLRVILTALSEYELQDVLDAATGIALSPFHMGDNDNGTKYNDITVALRDPTNIERFRDLCREPARKRKRPPIRDDWESTPSGIIDHRAIIHRD